MTRTFNLSRFLRKEDRKDVESFCYQLLKAFDVKVFNNAAYDCIRFDLADDLWVDLDIKSYLGEYPYTLSIKHRADMQERFSEISEISLVCEKLFLVWFLRGEGHEFIPQVSKAFPSFSQDFEFCKEVKNTILDIINGTNMQIDAYFKDPELWGFIVKGHWFTVNFKTQHLFHLSSKTDLGTWEELKASNFKKFIDYMPPDVVEKWLVKNAVKQCFKDNPELANIINIL